MTFQLLKRLIFSLWVLVLFHSCNSPKSAFSKGQYARSLHASINKIQKNPTNSKHDYYLKESYRKLNEADIDRIEFLKKSNEPKAWEDIYKRYTYLKSRQQMVKSLPRVALSRLGFQERDYDTELLNAKDKAVEYLYVNAQSLLDRNERQAARQAYYELQRVQQMEPGFRDVDQLVQQAKLNGTNNVLFFFTNETGMVMPQQFEYDLLKISMEDVSNEWVNYDTRENENIFYDYSIVLALKSIIISPDQVKEEDQTFERELEEGFRYHYDKNGNVAKDTAGNDIKIPVIKVIVCNLVTTHQFKSAEIIGSLDYYNNRTDELIKTDPIGVTTIFEHHSAKAVGDLRALPEEHHRMVGNIPVSFPNDEQLIMQAVSDLKRNTKRVVSLNRSLVMY